MTTGQPSEVDFDLLADYLGGALADTPEEAVVARLIDTDPEWAEASAALTQAYDSVQDSLTTWAAVTEPMPAELTARLTAVLADAGPVRQSTAIPTQPIDQSERRLNVVPGSGDRAIRGRDRTARAARRRWSRAAGPVAVAAAVVAFAGFGLSRMGGSTDDTSTAGTSNADTLASGVPPAMAQPVPEQLLATGTDYSSASVASAVARLRQQGTGVEERATGSPATTRAEDSDRHMLSANTALARLADPGALATCLEAVTMAQNLSPVTVNLVDFAAFEGSPALVVAFTDRTSARWVWVSGPNCGLPTAGPDTRYRAQVG